LKLTTVPFLHTSSILKADDSLSKADSVPWISTRVIITKYGSPFKGYGGVVKDVLRGQDTTSGLKIVLQLEHHDPSSPFKTIIVDYDGVVEQRSVKELHLQESILQVNMPSSKGVDFHFRNMQSLKTFSFSLQIWNLCGLSELNLHQRF
jgi:hypothetical protein